jgi:hypothetical protein
LARIPRLRVVDGYGAERAAQRREFADETPRERDLLSDEMGLRRLHAAIPAPSSDHAPPPNAPRHATGSSDDSLPADVPRIDNSRIDRPHIRPTEAQPAEFSSLVVDIQSWIRPLAQLILLAALLTAAGLCYLLLESTDGQIMPPGGAPPLGATSPGPQLTASVPNTSTEVATSLPLRGGASLASGAGEQPIPNLTVDPPTPYVANRPDRQQLVAAHNPLATNPPSGTSDRQLSEIFARPAQQQTAASVTPFPRTPFDAAQIGPVGPSAPIYQPGAEGPMAVAELTGDIQPVMTK